jgi:hypothetical protein
MLVDGEGVESLRSAEQPRILLVSSDCCCKRENGPSIIYSLDHYSNLMALNSVGMHASTTGTYHSYDSMRCVN